MKSPTRNCITLGSKNKSLSRQKKSPNFRQHHVHQSEIMENDSESRVLQNSFYQPQRSAIYDFDQQNSRVFYQSVNFHHQIPRSPQISRILKAKQNINRSSPFSKQKKTIRFIDGDRQGQTSPVSKFDSVKIVSNLSMNCHLKQNRIPTSQTIGIATQRQGDLLRKLKIVQGRLDDLLKQKQHMQATFTEQNRRLFHQNEELKQRLKMQELEDIQKIKIHELEEMLQIQINKSLQLMDQVQEKHVKNAALQQQCQSLKQKISTQETQITDLNTLNQSLKSETISLKDQFEKQIEAIQLTNDQIKMEFTNQILNLQLILSETQQNKVSIEEKLNIYAENQEKLQGTVNFQKQEITILKQKVIQLQQIQRKSNLLSSSNQSFMKKSIQSREECKKCQQLLKTVFKLNSHLNKEGKQ